MSLRGSEGFKASRREEREGRGNICRRNDVKSGLCAEDLLVGWGRYEMWYGGMKTTVTNGWQRSERVPAVLRKDTTGVTERNSQ
ncbi:hypothetical protein L873DRAFT_1805661 [Choiromyces venosus 120613-1]|uniref:Uncharacterized protein n=1 Tax=Choiromyces venosus 120613-1 TaxID=1336337 RepID=A0A3N4JVN4_9PEZI|nr:hypothetical protein L873DRAFT_1805661 [Choiromyces venosus 120613-1]